MARRRREYAAPTPHPSGARPPDLPAELVPRHVYANATAWRTSSWQLAAVAGPAIGGLLYAAAGPAAVYALDVVLMVVAVLALPLGRIRSALEDEDVVAERPPVVLPPNPPADWAVPARLGTDPPGVGPAAEEQAEAGHHHRLARTGLAGDDVHAAGQRQRGVLDDAQSGDAQLFQHSNRQ